ncbi:MAG TPA: hypothetical protein DDW98_09890 [Gammaproteobacteria bacterium]|nr:hypothetical protein [Gammaproteobacteria bacterium]HBG50406.1 hypothetical protein [Gammaproteobacteria bacterium]
MRWAAMRSQRQKREPQTSFSGLICDRGHPPHRCAPISLFRFTPFIPLICWAGLLAGMDS